MKELELKTEKGDFIMFDDAPKGDILVYKGSTYKRLFDLKNATEEQASEIVEETIMYNKHKIKCYRYRSYVGGFVAFDNANDSLHSLIESKGFNLFKNPAPLLSYSRIEAELNTFYNPTIYKKCTK